MVIVNSEPLLSLAQAAKLPVLGESVHVNTVRNWTKIGVSGHRLAARRIGGKLRTTQASVEAFLTAINSPNLGDTDDAGTVSNG